ncbi:hypothetical protein PFISCL1PPCAC_10562, partial [Pristionchus fissidentatus]
MIMLEIGDIIVTVGDERWNTRHSIEEKQEKEGTIGKGESCKEGFGNRSIDCRYRRSNGSREHDDRRPEHYDRERDREYRSRDREYPRNPEYPEEEYRRGGPEYDRDRERRDRERHHHEYRGEEYDRRYERERDRERDREYHERRFDGGPSSSQAPPTSGGAGPVNHIIPPTQSIAASNHLVQAGGHYTSQPGSSGMTPQLPTVPVHAQAPSTMQQQQQQYTGNGHVLTGTTAGMQHIQQGMAGMSLGSQQQLQQMQQTTPQQYGTSTGGYGSTGGQMMGHTPVMGGAAALPDGMNGGVKRVMIAKFDYDSRQLSPNVDAEQVELSFRQGDAITIYGEMDEDGFYMGELNGMRGLVPSNFLTSSSSLQSSPMARLAPSQPSEPMMMKSVGFSNEVKKSVPARQTSQTSTGAATAAGGGAKIAAKKTSVAQPEGAAKPLAKKTSDVGKGAPNARKTSTAVKKSEPAK